MIQYNNNEQNEYSQNLETNGNETYKFFSSYNQFNSLREEDMYNTDPNIYITNNFNDTITNNQIYNIEEPPLDIENKNKIENLDKDKKVKKEEKKKEIKPIIEDPDEMLFQIKDKENKKSEKDEEELSSESDKNSINYEEFEANQILCHYEKVKRIKKRWKIAIKGCVVQKGENEYIMEKVVGELERDW